MDALPGIRRILEVADLEGVPYDIVPGYESRGSGTFARIDVGLDHHDAFPARSGPWGGLRICTFGRADLRNSLCMFYLSSEERVPGWCAFAVVAARPSWHAGKGRLTTNTASRGIEARNDGLGERWPTAQNRTYLFLDAMTVIVWGARIFDHREHSSTGKIDRTGIDSHAWRSDVDREAARLLTKYPALRTGGPIVTRPTTPAKPAPPREDDDMTPDQAKMLAEAHQAAMEANVRAQRCIDILEGNRDKGPGGEDRPAGKATGTLLARIRDGIARVEAKG